MKKLTTRELIINGLLMALVFLATYFTRIPIPMTQGYFNIGDTVILVSAVLLGGTSGMVIGGIGSMLADIIGGYFLFAPLTLVVKALEGLVVGILSDNNQKKAARETRAILTLVIGALIMVVGYFIGETYILRLFDKTFGLTVAIAELPLNLLQGALSVIAAYIIIKLLNTINIKKQL